MNPLIPTIVTTIVAVVGLIFLVLLAALERQTARLKQLALAQGVELAELKREKESWGKRVAAQRTQIFELQARIAKEQAVAQEACGESRPSGDCGWVQELAGLFRVTRGQLESADSLAGQLEKKAREFRDRLGRIAIILFGEDHHKTDEDCVAEVGRREMETATLRNKVIAAEKFGVVTCVENQSRKPNSSRSYFHVRVRVGPAQEDLMFTPSGHRDMVGLAKTHRKEWPPATIAPCSQPRLEEILERPVAAVQTASPT